MKFGRAKKATLKISAHKLLLLAILPIISLAISILVKATYAKDLNASPNANSGSELVQITVLGYSEIIAFSANNLPGSGTEPDPYITNNAGVDADVELLNPGHLVIYDQDGNILATYDKTTSGTETITLHLELLDGIGDYILTAEYSNLKDNSDIYGALSIHIHWKAAIGPDEPQAPDTGYYYFAGYAIAQPNFWSFIIILLAAAMIAIGMVRKREKATVNKTKNN